MSCSVLCAFSVLELALAHVGDEEDNGEDDAKGANDDVTNSQEVVLTSEHVSGGEDKVFLSREATYVVVVLNLDSVGSCIEVEVSLSINTEFTPQFAEVRQTSGSHPDDKVF